MRNSRAVRTAALAVVGVATVVGLSACEMSGGGTFTSDAGANNKANVGLDIQCDVFGGGSGTFTFIDRGPTLKDADRVSVEGTVQGCIKVLGVVTATGTYQARPTGDGGKFRVSAVDTGKTGPDKGDKMRLDLFGGRFEGTSSAAPSRAGTSPTPVSCRHPSALSPGPQGGVSSAGRRCQQCCLPHLFGSTTSFRETPCGACTTAGGRPATTRMWLQGRRGSTGLPMVAAIERFSPSPRQSLRGNVEAPGRCFSSGSAPG